MYIQTLYDLAYFINTCDQITFDVLPTSSFRLKSAVDLFQCRGICG
jgi:hypothetical protein